MKLTLRKAHAIVKQLQRTNVISTESSAINVAMDEHKVDSIMTDVSAKHAAKIDLQLRVVEVLYAIRGSIQNLNSATSAIGGEHYSIDTLLNEKAKIERKLSSLQAFSGIGEFVEDTTVRDGLIASAKSEEKHYGRSMTNFGDLLKAHKEKYREDYYAEKRNLEAVVEKLAVLNNSISLELTADEVELLKTLRII